MHTLLHLLWLVGSSTAYQVTRLPVHSTPTCRCNVRHAAPLLCSPPPPEAPDENRPQTSSGDLQEEMQEDFDAGVEYGKSIVSRFTQPRIDDPGLPYADSLVCICGAMFVAALGLKGIIPQPSWLFPLLPDGIAPIRGLPYIVPAVSHGAGLAACWLLGALAAGAFSSEAYCSTLGAALSRTLKAGAFATGVLLLCTQLVTYVTLTAQGIDALDPVDVLAKGESTILTTADEVIFDVIVQATGLTAFRVYRWWDAQK